MFEQRANQSKPQARTRRSERLVLSVPVVVHRQAEDRPPFYEGTRTLVVSAHGALIALAANVALDQKLVLQNMLTGEEKKCRVAFKGIKPAGTPEVGVEFTRPASSFWRLAFPPADWPSR